MGPLPVCQWSPSPWFESVNVLHCNPDETFALPPNKGVHPPEGPCDLRRHAPGLGIGRGLHPFGLRGRAGRDRRRSRRARAAARGRRHRRLSGGAGRGRIGRGAGGRDLARGACGGAVGGRAPRGRVVGLLLALPAWTGPSTCHHARPGGPVDGGGGAGRRGRGRGGRDRGCAPVARRRARPGVGGVRGGPGARAGGGGASPPPRRWSWAGSTCPSGWRRGGRARAPAGGGAAPGTRRCRGQRWSRRRWRRSAPIPGWWAGPRCWPGCWPGAGGGGARAAPRPRCGAATRSGRVTGGSAARPRRHRCAVACGSGARRLPPRACPRRGGQRPTTRCGCLLAARRAGAAPTTASGSFGHAHCVGGTRDGGPPCRFSPPCRDGVSPALRTGRVSGGVEAYRRPAGVSSVDPPRRRRPVWASGSGADAPSVACPVSGVRARRRGRAVCPVSAFRPSSRSAARHLRAGGSSPMVSPSVRRSCALLLSHGSAAAGSAPAASPRPANRLAARHRESPPASASPLRPSSGTGPPTGLGAGRRVAVPRPSGRSATRH